MIKSKIEGIIIIIIGISVIYLTIKYPSKQKSVLLPDLSGLLSGLALIFIGILILIGQLNLNWF